MQPAAPSTKRAIRYGVGDLPLKELQFRSPLEVGNVSNFDEIAECGMNGLLDPVEPGLACGSDTAHLQIFGYDPRRHYKGRGVFEASGTGLMMRKGDVAFKSNFATLEKSTQNVIFRRCDRVFEKEGPILSEFLNDISIPGFPDVRVSVKYATEHRCAVRLRGPGLCDRVSGTDPLVDNLKLLRSKPTDETSESVTTAAVVNAVSDRFQELLSEHPVNLARASDGKNVANVVLLRGPGSLLEAPQFQDSTGFSPFMIAPTAIIAGIGSVLGFEIIKAPGATGDYRSDLNAKALALIEALETRAPGTRNFGFLHVKGVDDAGHDGLVDKKLEMLERANVMVGTLVDGLIDISAKTKEKFAVLVFGDHSTPIGVKEHSCEPVPFSCCLLENLEARRGGASVPVGTGAYVDSVRTYSETAACDGSLGRFPGKHIMPLARKLASV